jgi:hypothetical protein
LRQLRRIRASRWLTIPTPLRPFHPTIPLERAEQPSPETSSFKIFLPSASTNLRQPIQKLLLPGGGLMVNINRLKALHPPQLSYTCKPNTACLP